MRSRLGALALVALCGCVIDVLTEDDVGDAPACEAAHRWPRVYADREDVLVGLIEDARAAGGKCGKSKKNPVQALDVSPELHCAARIHATQIVQTGKLSHDGPDGSTTLSRVDAAQYDGIPRYELLAADYLNPADVLAAWLGNPDDCAAIYDSHSDALGVGHAQNARGDRAAWVLLTGEKRE